MRKMILMTMACSVLVLGGCAKTANITYNSIPLGAELREGGRHLGYAPMTFNYTWKPNSQNKCIKVSPVTAIWMSGANISNESNPVTLCESGNFAATPFNRPADVPGIENDMEFALQLQGDRARARQMREAENEEAMMQIGSALQGQSWNIGQAAYDLGRRK